MYTALDITFMTRALELAALGQQFVSPNPMVGAVIVHEGKIIGEGYHQQYGQAHAEVNAVKRVADKKLLPKSKLYVTLEPCTHHGKTPPCTDLILEYKIPHVIIACKDTSSKVNGRGVQKLKEAGVKVSVGLLEKEALYLNRRFFTCQTLKRPFVIAKWAACVNGFMAKLDQKGNPVQVQITGALSQVFSHKMRAQETAILVGTTTALIDNPRLTTRKWKGKNPMRVVIDKSLKIPCTHKIFDGTAPTFIVCEKIDKNKHHKGVQYLELAFNSSFEQNILAILYDLGVSSVIIEGGSATLDLFIQAKLVDEYWVFRSKTKKITKGAMAPKLNKVALHEQIDLRGDTLSIYN